MKLFGWFKKNEEINELKVSERKTSLLADAASAIAFAEVGEHETARQIMAEPQGARQIMVVSTGEYFSGNLVNYSVAMAKRLNFQLLAVNTTTAPLTLPSQRQEEAVAIFRENSERNVLELKEKAENNQVHFNHFIELGHQDEVVDRLYAIHPAMRYVLTEPDPEVLKKSSGKIDIPVFDMNSYQGMLA